MVPTRQNLNIHFLKFMRDSCSFVLINTVLLLDK
jgi:hypothetical protein